MTVSKEDLYLLGQAHWDQNVRPTSKTPDKKWEDLHEITQTIIIADAIKKIKKGLKPNG